MKLRVTVDNTDWPCDVCNDEGPTLSEKIRLNDPYSKYNDTILIHVHCFMASAAVAIEAVKK